MGGLATEVTDATTDILIEAAHFDPVTVARTARRHKLWSEASKRFERGVDPTLGPIAAQRVADLLVQLAGGTIDKLGVVVPYLGEPVPIAFSPTSAQALIGVDYTEDEVRSSLELIGATVETTVDRWTVTPPSWRPDLTDAPSLIEEVARITGLRPRAVGAADRAPGPRLDPRAGRPSTPRADPRRRGTHRGARLPVPVGRHRRAVRARCSRRSARERDRPAVALPAALAPARAARDGPPQRSRAG